MLFLEYALSLDSLLCFGGILASSGIFRRCHFLHEKSSGNFPRSVGNFDASNIAGPCCHQVGREWCRVCLRIHRQWTLRNGDVILFEVSWIWKVSMVFYSRKCQWNDIFHIVSKNWDNCCSNVWKKKHSKQMLHLTDDLEVFHTGLTVPEVSPTGWWMVGFTNIFDFFLHRKFTEKKHPFLFASIFLELDWQSGFFWNQQGKPWCMMSAEGLEDDVPFFQQVIFQVSCSKTVGVLWKMTAKSQRLLLGYQKGIL